MALNQTILIDYELILTGTRKRNSINNDTASYLSTTGVDNRYINVEPGQQIILTDILGFFFLRTSDTMQLRINNGVFFPVSTIFVTDSAFAQVTLFNTTENAVSCLVVTA